MLVTFLQVPSQHALRWVLSLALLAPLVAPSIASARLLKDFESAPEKDWYCPSVPSQLCHDREAKGNAVAVDSAGNVWFAPALKSDWGFNYVGVALLGFEPDGTPICSSLDSEPPVLPGGAGTATKAIVAKITEGATENHVYVAGSAGAGGQVNWDSYVVRFKVYENAQQETICEHDDSWPAGTNGVLITGTGQYDEIDGLWVTDDDLYVAGWADADVDVLDVLGLHDDTGKVRIQKFDLDRNPGDDDLWDVLWDPTSDTGGGYALDTADGGMVVLDVAGTNHRAIYVSGRHGGDWFESPQAYVARFVEPNGQDANNEDEPSDAVGSGPLDLRLRVWDDANPNDGEHRDLTAGVVTDGSYIYAGGYCSGDENLSRTSEPECDAGDESNAVVLKLGLTDLSIEVERISRAADHQSFGRAMAIDTVRDVVHLAYMRVPYQDDGECSAGPSANELLSSVGLKGFRTDDMVQLFDEKPPVNFDDDAPTQACFEEHVGGMALTTDGLYVAGHYDQDEDPPTLLTPEIDWGPFLLGFRNDVSFLEGFDSGDQSHWTSTIGSSIGADVDAKLDGDGTELSKYGLEVDHVTQGGEKQFVRYDFDDGSVGRPTVFRGSFLYQPNNYPDFDSGGPGPGNLRQEILKVFGLNPHPEDNNSDPSDPIKCENWYGLSEIAAIRMFHFQSAGGTQPNIELHTRGNSCGWRAADEDPEDQQSVTIFPIDNPNSPVRVCFQVTLGSGQSGRLALKVQQDGSPCPEVVDLRTASNPGWYWNKISNALITEFSEVRLGIPLLNNNGRRDSGVLYFDEFKSYSTGAPILEDP